MNSKVYVTIVVACLLVVPLFSALGAPTTSVTLSSSGTILQSTSPTATPNPTATATPNPTATATPNPTATPTPAPTGTPKPTPTPTPAPTGTPKPTPTPTPTSTPAPSGTNLCAINNGWWYTDDTWTNCPAENILYSTSMEYQGNPSWEIEASSIQNYGVDCSPGDNGPIALTPGETVVMECAIYTAGTSLGAGIGGSIGLDFYGASGRIGQANCPADVNAEKETGATPLTVPYGTDAWTLVTWTVTIPSDYTSASGTLVPITGCIPWCAASNAAGNPDNYANVWFSDFQFYINP